MRHIDWQLERFASEPAAPALIWRDREYSYGDLHDRVLAWEKTLVEQDSENPDRFSDYSLLR